MPDGYYRYPTIHEDNIVFVAEDDLWTVNVDGGIARRLTSNLGRVYSPALSPDGSSIAFVGTEEGQPEVYLMPSTGGVARRLTYIGGSACVVVGWRRDETILFSNNSDQPFSSLLYMYSLNLEGNRVERLDLGPAQSIAYQPDGNGVIIGRNIGDPAQWKRYRGGTAGRLWIDVDGTSEFVPLIDLEGNLASPLWLGGRIYFLSDHEGMGNLYSCTPEGGDLHRHTDHVDFYTRNASSDGHRIVYHAGGDLFIFDPAEDRSRRIDLQFFSPQAQRNRKFIYPGRYLEAWSLHPDGRKIVITARGKPVFMGLWDGSVNQVGKPQGIRYRLPRWLHDGDRLIAITDEGGDESLIAFFTKSNKPAQKFSNLDIGRVDSILVNPVDDRILLSNNRFELLVFNLGTGELKLIDRGKGGHINGFDWSPDGNWVVYSLRISSQVSVIKLWHASRDEYHQITSPVLKDFQPVFDKKGRYICFLSKRHFNPVYDNMQFDLNFPLGEKPFLITLRKDIPSPFIPASMDPELDAGKSPEPEDEDGDSPPDRGHTSEAAVQTSQATGDQPHNTHPQETTDKEEPSEILIDLEGIEQRILAFPTREAIYERIRSTADGNILYSIFPPQGSVDDESSAFYPTAAGELVEYNFEDQKEETLFQGVHNFDTNLDGSIIIYRYGARLRVIDLHGPTPKASDTLGRESGWVDLSRIRISILPGEEWKQMYTEAWRLQRDQFWTPDMSNIDWIAIYSRYLPLIDRVSSRDEFSDLLREMQGELGTSHTYELGGDYRPQPFYQQGFLGADISFDEEANTWVISEIPRGDSWIEGDDSPLNQPGLNVEPGDHLLKINGFPLSLDVSPHSLLVNMANTEVSLTIRTASEDQERVVTVKTLASTSSLRYRDWVNRNRTYVHEKTDGQVGYIHIPDMEPNGYAEFHRSYLAEVDRQALIVDLRFNSGGFVSPLILEKLSRRRIGYRVSRWHEDPRVYPPESISGPIVALTNEQTSSDGDIFSHGFKLLQLGPLIGKRTWGGVVGYWWRQSLVDGTRTTQPESHLWFVDVGWAVENYGVEPDIEVDITPQEYSQGIDSQLDVAIKEILDLLKDSPPIIPNFGPKPDRSAPRLPDRPGTYQEKA